MPCTTPRRLVTQTRRPVISNKVFVGNLSFDVTREELLEAFGAAGQVVDAKIPTDRDTGRPRGFAFVEFPDDDTAQRAISLLNGKSLRGRPLRVNEAENRPPRPVGGGGPRAGGFGGGGGYSPRPSYGPRGGGPSSFQAPPPEFGTNEFAARKGDGRPPRRFTTKDKAPRRPEPRRRRGNDFDDD